MSHHWRQQMSRAMWQRTVAWGLVASLLAVCHGERYYGPPTFVPDPNEPGQWMRSAYVRGYVDLPTNWREGMAPLLVGLEMTADFVAYRNSLPLNHTFVKDYNFTIKAFTTWVILPRQDAQPFKRVLFVWEATGHPPMNVYARPHFDIHFTLNPAPDWSHMFDHTNRTMGPCMGLTPAGFWKMFEPIPAQCFPGRTHAQLGDVKYGHASHLVPVKFGKEWNPPSLFNQTMIFGQWGGEVQFIEPMVSFDWLNSTEARSEPHWYDTNSPEYWDEAQHYPERYGYWWAEDQSSVHIELTQFKPSKVCQYDPEHGWAGWYPATSPLPGPKGECLAPTPESWPCTTCVM